jgi:hypothetical protein
LISVDFPAPLSPRRHVTVPGRTSIEMSLIAITLPKYFESCLVSRSASSISTFIDSPPSSG